MVTQLTKKYKRFYLVEKKKGVSYHKLESDLPFEADEGVKSIEKSTPDTTKVEVLNKKMVKFLELK